MTSPKQTQSLLDLTSLKVESAMTFPTSSDSCLTTKYETPYSIQPMEMLAANVANMFCNVNDVGCKTVSCDMLPTQDDDPEGTSISKSLGDLSIGEYDNFSARKKAVDVDFTSAEENVDGNDTSVVNCCFHGDSASSTASQTLDESTFSIQDEELLQDVLYSVQSLMSESDSWYAYRMILNPNLKASSGEGRAVTSSPRSVTQNDLMELLQEAFNVDREAIERLKENARQLKPPLVLFQLTVREGNIQCQRSASGKGTTNTYVKVTIPGFEQVHKKTEIIKDSLNPKWREDFSLFVHDLKHGYLQIELWQENEEDERRRARILAAVGGSPKPQRSIMLAGLQMPLKEFLGKKIDGWYSLKVEDGGNCTVAKLYLAGYFSSASAIDTRPRSTHEELIIKLFNHYLIQMDSTTKVDSEGLLSCISVISTHHAVMTNIGREAQQLFLWVALTQASKMDMSWILSCLKNIQASLVSGSFDLENQLRLRTSLSEFIVTCMEQIRHLNTSFPASHYESSKTQLESLLKVLDSIQSHPETRELLSHIHQPLISESIVSALRDHAAHWWKTSAKPVLRNASSLDDLLRASLTITTNVLHFVQTVSQFYSDIFLSNAMKIPCLHYLYGGVVKMMVDSLRPVIISLCDKLLDTETSDGSNMTFNADFGVGSSLWKIYKNLTVISLLGQQLLPENVCRETGLLKFYEWFIPAVHHWRTLTQERAQTQVLQAVQDDHLKSLDDYTAFSLSSNQTTAVFHNLKVWWHKLAWPDVETGSHILLVILEDLSQIGEEYCDCLGGTVHRILKDEASGKLGINGKVCVGLANMDRVQQEVHRLPEIFGWKHLSDRMNEEMSAAQTQQLNDSLEALIKSSVDNIKKKTSLFIDKILAELKSTLEKCVIDACETGDSDVLLGGLLCPAFHVLHKEVADVYYHHFLWGFWENTLKIFMMLIADKTEGSESYFQRVYKILEQIFTFFTPDIGLDPVEAKIPAYLSIMEQLEILRMRSDAIIAKFYRERFHEQNLEATPKRASIVIRAYFKDMEKLIVKVIMLKDVTMPGQENNSKPEDYYVKVQVVPENWFTAISCKTKIVKEDPAVFDEEFTFDISPTADGIKAGALLLTVKDHNKSRSNTFIGEAVVLLADLQEETSVTQNMYLKMTSPYFEKGYLSLQALQCRESNDAVAASFLKVLSKQHPNARLKKKSRIEQVFKRH